MAATQPDDMVMLIFAGHGGTSQQGPTKDELFEFETYSNTPNAIDTDHSITSAELADLLKRLSARRIVLIMDSCESGAVLSPLGAAIVAKMEDSLAATNVAGAPDSPPG